MNLAHFAATLTLLFCAAGTSALEQDGKSALELFIVSSGTVYGLEQLPGGGPLLLSDGGALAVVSLEGRERIAEHAASMSGPDASIREFEKLKTLLTAQKLWNEETEKLFSAAPRTLNEYGKNILMQLLAESGGNIRNRIMAPARGPVRAGTGNASQSYSVEWERVDEAARTGNFEKLSGYTFDRKAGTIRVMVSGKRPQKQEILTGKDVTPAREKEVLSTAGLPEDLQEECGGRLVRVIGGTLFYDIPLDKARSFAEKCSRAGVSVRPALIFRAK